MMASNDHACGTIIKALIGMTVLGSVFVCIHERQKISKLSFDGNFKTDDIMLLQADRILTTYAGIEQDT
jgi:hypothetical protein